MFRTGRTITSAVITAACAVIGLLVFGIPAAYAQTQPGRFLVSPPSTVILECNVDGTACFNRTRSGGDANPATAIQPSVATNGTVVFNARFAPDGTCVVGGQGICWYHVFAMNADGTNVRQLTFVNGDSHTAGDSAPSISPDGSTVAFISNRTPAYDANGSPSYLSEIYLVNVDGSGLRQITFPVVGQAGTPQAGNPYGNVQSVAWSPDGSKLAYKANTYGAFCGLSFGMPVECEVVATINADGTGLNYLQIFNVNEAGGEWAIDWSPDGTLIAYAHNSANFGGPAIGIIDLSGQGRFAAGLSLAQLGTQSTFAGNVCPTDVHCFHFSPDSTRLAYENNGPSDNPSFSGISTISLDGTGRIDGINFGARLENGLWWVAGSTLPVATQLTLAPDPVEVWPGSPKQLVPTLVDASDHLIAHTAASYTAAIDYGTSGCIGIGPYGLVSYTGSGNGSGSITATNESLNSNAVLFRCWSSAPCTFTLTPTSNTYTAVGGADSVVITANPNGSGSNCPWDAATNTSWITITSSSSGTGSGSVAFSVAENTGPARQGTMTIAGATFTVNQDASGPPQAVSITVAPASASIPAGLTQAFTATAHFSDGSTTDTTTSAGWSSSNSGIATVSNASGSQGVATGVAAGGPITITAAWGGLTGTAQLTVTAPLLVSLAVSPSSPSVAVGGTQQFTANGTYSDGVIRNITSSVTWTSSNTTVGTINASGLASAIATGTTTISAQQGSVSNSTTMTVVSLQSVTLSPLAPTILVGSPLQFVLTGHYSDGSLRNLSSVATWTSSKTSIATITSPGGLATGVAKGSTMIRGSFGGFTASTTLMVSTPVLQSIAVTPSAATIGVGGTQAFTATGTYSNGATSNLTNAVTWSSSSKMVASINSTGLATGLRAGTATITAKMGGVSGAATLTIR